MKKLVLTALLGLFIINLQAQSKDKKEIKQCFQSYKKAILNDQGKKAVNYLSDVTIQYYQKMIDLSLAADSAQLADLGLMDRFMVFALKHRTPLKDIRSFDGRQALVYAIEEGMVGKNSVANNSVGTISLNGNKAKAQVVVNDVPSPLDFTFFKENGNWKFDLTSLFPVSETGFKRIIEQSDKTENEFLFYLLEMTTGKKPTNTIWQPIGK